MKLGKPVYETIHFLSGEGEVIKTEKVETYNKVIDRDLCTLFYDLVVRFMKDQSKSHTIVLFALLEMYGTKKEIVMSEPELNKVARAINRDPRTVKEALNKLTDACVLLTKEKDRYWINPQFVWKGPKHERAKTYSKLIKEGWLAQ
jgi:predicted transcriptional regulator